MVESEVIVDKFIKAGRYLAQADKDDEDLGPLQLLPGTWKAEGTG